MCVWADPVRNEIEWRANYQAEICENLHSWSLHPKRAERGEKWSILRCWTDSSSRKEENVCRRHTHTQGRSFSCSSDITTATTILSCLLHPNAFCWDYCHLVRAEWEQERDALRPLGERKSGPESSISIVLQNYTHLLLIVVKSIMPKTDPGEWFQLRKDVLSYFSFSHLAFYLLSRPSSRSSAAFANEISLSKTASKDFSSSWSVM